MIILSEIENASFLRLVAAVGRRAPKLDQRDIHILQSSHNDAAGELLEALNTLVEGYNAVAPAKPAKDAA